MHILLERQGESVRASEVTSDGTLVGELDVVPIEDLAELVESYELEGPRWIWDDTSRWYPPLLAAGVRVERVRDLRLAHAILRHSALTASSALATSPPDAWDIPLIPDDNPTPPASSLFEWDVAAPATAEAIGELAEFRRQCEAIAGSAQPGSLALLIAAESAGALIAAEMRYAGLPWNAEVHDQLLTEMLGPRPAPGIRPAEMERLLAEFRTKLDDPTANPDSPDKLLKALGNAGIQVNSTSQWELREIEHPAIEPLLAYKKLSRLLTANGWNWLDEWVHDGRFRPQFIVGGAATGRWASSGGGALQLPKQIRGAVIADPGWKLVVADASQVEPRILAAMSGDLAMARAGQGQDMYAGIVASGAVATREQAKVGMLGAMYGGTTGESGRQLPRLTKAFPQAIALVEAAARAGERGEVVSTRLGRSSPPGPERPVPTNAAEQARDQSRRRSWGRFTRNFIVQGTAAEWAMCWMAGLRGRLTALASDEPLLESPHLVFFLHDEVIVHAPEAFAEAVADEIRAAAADAGRLLFGDFPVAFPLTVAIVDRYSDAK